jgi:hypothetical protein
MAEERVLRFDRSAISKTRQGPSGGLIVSGNLRRTGVLEYRLADGSTRRELVHPDEAFHADARESFKGAPITEDHPGRVDPSNWAAHAVGHVGDTPTQDGRFLRAELHIQDGKTIQKVKSKQLQEISCGYECGIDPTPGEWNGQKYDCVQTNPIGNHVALGPAGWGRAGPEVSLHMDGGVSTTVDEVGETHVDAPALNEDQETVKPTFAGMTEEEKARLAKLEADLKSKDEELAALRADSAKATTAAEKAVADAKELEVLRAKTQLLEAQAARFDEAKNELENQARQDSTINEIVSLREMARKVFSTSKDPSGAKWKADGKKPDDIRREVLAVIEPNFKLVKQDGTALDGDALDAVYRQAIDHAARVDTARGAAHHAAAGPRVDGKKKDEDEDDDMEMDAAKARKDMIKRDKARYVSAVDRKDRMFQKGAR